MVIFGIFASGTLGVIPFWLSRDMVGTCKYYRENEIQMVAGTECGSQVCADAKMAYIDEVCVSITEKRSSATQSPEPAFPSVSDPPFFLFV